MSLISLAYLTSTEGDWKTAILAPLPSDRLPVSEVSAQRTLGPFRSNIASSKNPCTNLSVYSAPHRALTRSGRGRVLREGGEVCVRRSFEDKLTWCMPSANRTPGDFIDFNGGAVQLQASPTTTSHALPTPWVLGQNRHCGHADVEESTDEDVTEAVEINLLLDASCRQPPTTAQVSSTLVHR